MATWRALVLGGGGSTGEFQMGALPVLARAIPRFDFFAGVGVGSLHSTVLAQFPQSFPQGVEALQGMWNQIQGDGDILETPFYGTALSAVAALAGARNAVHGNAKLRRLIEQHVDWKRLEPLRNWGIEITSLSDGLTYFISNDPAISEALNVSPRTLRLAYANAQEEHYLGKLVHDLVLAGGSVPFMFPPVQILGHLFVEGGLRHFIPLGLAVEAFRRAWTRDQSLIPEFFIVDNYTAEIQHETADLLRGGAPTVLRAIKIMTVEMAQNDMSAALGDLDRLGVRRIVHELRPRLDFRLNPMDFENRDLREKIREEGATVAELQFPEADAEVGRHVKALRDDPRDRQAAERIAVAMRQRERYEEARRPKLTTSVAPKDLQELVELMLKCRREGRHLKPVGAGYAFSRVCETDGVTVDLGPQLNRIFPTDASVLNVPASADELVEFEAGATIEKLNDYLWGNGRTLLNQPGYEKLTFFGVATAGGHGSGMRHPPLSEAIRALHLAGYDAQGRLVLRRVEPHNGITNPARWQARNPKILLEQNDELFHALTVSFGTLGIVTSVVCATQPSFFLEEKRTFSNWRSARTRLPQLLGDESVHSIHLWINAYPTHGEHSVVVSEYRSHPGPASGERGWGTTFGGVATLTPILSWFMKIDTDAIPFLIDSALHTTVPSGPPPVLPCYEALNFGTPNQVKVDPTNIGVPLARVDEVVDALLAFFADEEMAPKHRFITAPIGLRFTPETKAFLSPQRGRPTCMIELPFLKGTEGDLESIRDLQRMLYGKFEGRPHWGQIHDLLDPSWMNTIFGHEQDAFRRAREVLDPVHAFASYTTRQIGLDEPRLAEKPDVERRLAS